MLASASLLQHVGAMHRLHPAADPEYESHRILAVLESEKAEAAANRWLSGREEQYGELPPEKRPSWYNNIVLCKKKLVDARGYLLAYRVVDAEKSLLRVAEHVLPAPTTS